MRRVVRGTVAALLVGGMGVGLLAYADRGPAGGAQSKAPSGFEPGRQHAGTGGAPPRAASTSEAPAAPESLVRGAPKFDLSFMAPVGECLFRAFGGQPASTKSAAPAAGKPGAGDKSRTQECPCV